MNYRFAYAYASLILLAVWGLLWCRWRPQRDAMFWSGLVLIPYGPIVAYWFTRHYWWPGFVVEFRLLGARFGFEDFLVPFALGGICAGAFERVARRRGMPPLPPTGRRCLGRVAAWNTLGLVVLILLNEALHLGAAASLILAIAGTALLMLAPRPRLLGLSLALAAAATLAYWVFYKVVFLPVFPRAFHVLWDRSALWGIDWAGVPVEEILWVGATMFYAGPLIRACSDATDAGQAVG